MYLLCFTIASEMCLTNALCKACNDAKLLVILSIMNHDRNPLLNKLKATQHGINKPLKLMCNMTQMTAS